ncbi:glucose-1-phosphate adenylyltransferase subunit GlgD [Eubacteriales bacterium OttesenSCG-928-G02]|nr:glucose-1-phosphate adenylyltransferase subunit GlgD [Eubacteriales bacterium OttesenSCG-928-G02]
MSVFGLIFSNIHDKNIPELTTERTMASVPFGCRYRLIDFTLSNMVNSGIDHVGVITHYNYQSLMDHLGSGKDWDLARSTGGIKILPPYITASITSTNFLYSTRLEALKNIVSFISGCKEDYVIMSDCNVICNMDFNDILDYHIAQNADMTVAVKRIYITPETAKNCAIVEYDENNIIKSVTDNIGNKNGFADMNINIIVTRRRFLEMMIRDAIAYNYNSFYLDIIGKNLDNYKICAYKYDGYYSLIDSIQSYYLSSMDLLNPYVRNDLFNVQNRPVFTKVKNSPPTVYSDQSKVVNSLIADGCIIEGTVENSILFRGVKVGKNTNIKNSILMQDSLTGEDVALNCVITDKNVIIRDGRTLSGHETRPFYIGKMVQI